MRKENIFQHHAVGVRQLIIGQTGYGKRCKKMDKAFLEKLRQDKFDRLESEIRDLQKENARLRETIKLLYAEKLKNISREDEKHDSNE